MTGGYPVGGLPKDFFVFGDGQIGFVPLPVVYMLVIFAVGAFVLSSTPFGRSIYAIGGNEDAARLSGISVMRVKIGVFIVCAFVSAISGLVLSSRLMAGSPEIGVGWELDVIAAVVIGGTNIFGGEGKLGGTLLGVLFIGVLTNGMILLDVTPYMQLVVRGLVILESVREHHLELHSFRVMRRMEASLRKASALRLRHSQSLASLRHRPSQAKVRSTIHRLGKTTKRWA